MATRQKSPFSAEHIAQFHRIQALRPVILHKLGDLLEVWRGCEKSTCVRARSCRRSDTACLTAFMQAMPDENRRLFRHALEYRQSGLRPRRGDRAGEKARRRRERPLRGLTALPLWHAGISGNHDGIPGQPRDDEAVPAPRLRSYWLDRIHFTSASASSGETPGCGGIVVRPQLPPPPFTTFSLKVLVAASSFP